MLFSDDVQFINEYRELCKRHNKILIDHWDSGDCLKIAKVIDKGRFSFSDIDDIESWEDESEEW